MEALLTIIHQTMKARNLLRTAVSSSSSLTLCQARGFASSNLLLSAHDDQQDSSGSSSSSPSPPEKKSPYDDLFSGPNPFPRTSPRWLSPDRERRDLSSQKVPRSVLFASDDSPRPFEARRRKPDRSPLTANETNAFMSLLNEATDASPREVGERPFGAYTDMITHDSPRTRNAQLLEAYAQRNRIAPRPRHAARRAVREGLAATVSAAELESGIDEAREQLTMCENEHEVWLWASTNLWASEGRFGRKTPYYAPVLHLLLLTLRDRYRRPHSALAVLDVTRKLGVESYVLGCTAPLYVELLKTRWDWLADIRGCRNLLLQARETGVLANPASRLREIKNIRSPPPAEDEGIREVVDRIKSEARKMALEDAATRSRETQEQYLYGEEGEESKLLEPHFAQKQMLDLAEELGKLAGQPTRKVLDALNEKAIRRRRAM